jgi:PAS domain S-box-containing protein
MAPLWRALIESAPIGIMSTAGETGRFELVNNAFAQMLGRSVAELMESDPFQIWQETTHPDDQATEREAITRVARGELDRYTLEKRVIAPGGTTRWVRVDLSAMRAPSGRLERVLVFFTDVNREHEIASQREQLEAQVREAQKLDAIGKLAGGVAHDFNNRLLIIIGYAELLRNQLSEGSAFREPIDAVLTSAQRAAELTRRLLASSRRQVLKPQRFDLNQTVEGMRRLLERVIGDRIELATMLRAERVAFCDPAQIEQVLLNLAINARDAMPDGGTLTLSTADTSVSHGEGAIPAGDYVLLTISDTGTGISDDVMPHIFEPFFTTKGIGQGTGLGLSVVEGIVRQSGGDVQVTTVVGRGTTFHVRLPHASGPPSPRYISVPAPAGARHFETVLVCDDDDDVRKLLVDLLDLRAYRILEASNGAHALRIADGHHGPIDLLITDVVMPRIGGIELASRLRRRDPSLRVLYLSGYTEDAAQLSVSGGPRTQFLAKPFSPGDLTRAVSSMLERQT